MPKTKSGALKSRAEKRVVPKKNSRAEKKVVPKKTVVTKKKRVVPEKTNVVKKKLDEKN